MLCFHLACQLAFPFRTFCVDGDEKNTKKDSFIRFQFKCTKTNMYIRISRENKIDANGEFGGKEDPS